MHFVRCISTSYWALWVLIQTLPWKASENLGFCIRDNKLEGLRDFRDRFAV